SFFAQPKRRAQVKATMTIGLVLIVKLRYGMEVLLLGLPLGEEDRNDKRAYDRTHAKELEVVKRLVFARKEPCIHVVDELASQQEDQHSRREIFDTEVPEGSDSP